MEPDEWGAKNRRYPTGHDLPGPRDPTLTPYMIPFGRSVASRLYRKVAMACSAQSGKTECLLDVIGHRFHTAPAPVLMTGPTKQWLTEQMEPRVMRLLDEAPVLVDRVARGKRMTKTRKVINGAPLRMAHGGSSTALKSDMFALAVTDECDELQANVKGQGDPIKLIDLRGETVVDFVHAIVSTPSLGSAEIEEDPVTKLQFWKYQDPKTIESTIWRIFQEGTRRHFAWKCPHCGEWFIPRSSLLRYDEKAAPIDIKESAVLACPRNGCLIEDASKFDMNKGGVYVAPGQTIAADGQVDGDPPRVLTDSYWVSGICSPFKTFGERAAELAEAKCANDPAKLQAVLSGMFGELTSPLAGGEGLDAADVKAKALPYKRGEVPNDVMRLVAGVDVQTRSIYYSLIGFGARGAAWVLDYDQLHGSTDQDEVWFDLANILQQPIGGMFVELALVDSGFRPDKREPGSVHRVYDFCRANKYVAKPAKGWDSRSQPLIVKKIEVKPTGKQLPFSLELVHANSDFFKSLAFLKFRTPLGQPGGAHVMQDVGDDYCEQIASEVRLIESHKPVWKEKHPHNHYLDCFSLALAAGWLLNVQRIPDGVKREDEPVETDEPPQVSEQVTVAPEVAARSLSLRERMAKRASLFRR